MIPTAYAGKIGAPYAPTRLPVVKKAFDWAGIGASDTLVDLGAGDGKILLEAARRGATAIGYELSPIMWAIAWVRITLSPLLRGRSSRRRRASPVAGGGQAGGVKFANFYKQTLSPKTNRIFAFLMPHNMARVAAFLKQQKLPDKTLVFAYAFPFTEVEPLTVIRAKNCAPLYIYELKAITS